LRKSASYPEGIEPPKPCTAALKRHRVTLAELASAPTTTLGCGSWGGNSISENLDYKHLMNVSRNGKPITKPVPTDEEIWA
jgi:hypothetical protein